METLNKVQLIGRLMKTSKLIQKNGRKWIYAWLDTNLHDIETKAMKIKAYNNQADLLCNDYMIGATLYIEGKLAYYDDTIEIDTQNISCLSYSRKKQNAVKDAFNSLNN